MAVPKAIQIRGVPDDVHSILRARAAAAGMSMSEYLRGELIRTARQETVAEVMARARSRHGGIRPGIAAETIREMRGPIPP